MYLPKRLQALNQKFGLVGPADLVQPFKAHLQHTYPGLEESFALAMNCSVYPLGTNLTGVDPFLVPDTPAVPAWSDDMFRFFASDQELEQYTQGSKYGRGGEEELYGAVVFNSGAPDWRYTLRMNLSSTPNTAMVSDNLQRGVDLDNLLEYFVAKPDPSPKDLAQSQSAAFEGPGFAALQLAVDRFIINATMPKTNATLQNEAVLFSSAWGCNNSQAIFEGGGVTPDFDSKVLNGLLASTAYAPQRVVGGAFPTSAYKKSPFYDAAKNVFALFFLFAFMYPAFVLIRSIVAEKETRVREGMRMMGMGEVSLFAAWYITYIIIFTAVAVLVVIVTGSNIFGRSDFFLMFLVFWLFGVSSVALCFLISAFFSRSKLAAVVGTVLYIAAFFPYYNLNDPLKPYAGKAAASLLSPTAFGLVMDVLATLEANDVGLQWGNLYQQYGNYSVGAGMFMMFVDFFIYTVIGYYVDQTFPSEFGVQRPWYFCLTGRFWCGASKANKGSCADDNTGDVQLAELSSSSAQTSLLGNDGGAASHGVKGVPPGVDPATYEAAGAHLRQLAADERYIKIRELKKEFPSPDGMKTAVDGLTLDMYEGQIFALLGHNGAGKTTAISMLTGLLPPTGGGATIAGKDIASDMAGIRHSLGVCPQHDVLWDDLTVEEHLQFFAGLKGVPKDEIPATVKDIIVEVGLTEKVKYLSSQLSGGQKRKLSVAIALIGGSKVVFLDEPTSGMDPYSRRSTWQILQNAREGRIMVLTTHFMDEADLLGDRIGIMSEGKLVCCGSSMFLKRMYGVGYSLTVVKQPSCDEDALEKLVAQHVPKYKVLSNVGAEISFQIPMSASASFPELFRQFEDDSAGFGVETYGIGVTTLEEVFLKVAELGAEAAADTAELDAGGAALVPSAGGSSVQGAGAAAPAKATKVSSAMEASRGEGKWKDDYVRSPDMDSQDFFMIHFKALLLKRFRVALRDKKAMVFQLLIPVLALLGGLLLLKLNPPLNPPALVLYASGINPSLTSMAPLAEVYPSGGAAGSISVPANDIVVKESAGGSAWAAAVNRRNGTTRVVSGLPAKYPYIGLNISAQPACIFPNPVYGVSPTELEYLWTPANVFADPLGSMGELSQWLLANKGNEAPSRYGAFAVPSLELGQAATKQAPLPGSAHSALATGVFMVNTTLFHGVPSFLNIFTSTLYNMTLAADSTAVAAGAGGSITVVNHPLPYTIAQKGILSAATSFVTVLFIVISFSFIPASFAVFIVREREINAKHQQLISGVSMVAYWASTYLWDFVNYLPPCIMSIVLIVAFDVRDLIDDGALGAVVALFVLYGLSVAAFTYVLSYAFKSHSTAQTVVLILNLFCMILLLASFIMQQIESTCKADRALRFIYRFLPGYSLGNGLLQLSLMKGLAYISSNCGELTPAEQYAQVFKPFSLSVAGWPVIYMALLSVLYFGAAFGIDVLLSYPVIKSKLLPDKDTERANFEVDADVQREEERVMGGHADGEAIVVKGLRKVYGGSKPAVRNMTFGIPKGQVFGFLGINGAGKTSTLKMLSGDIVPTSGSAKLQGMDIMHEQIECRRLLGYCPQFDALFELLTVREHLELYARIKGVPDDKMENVVQAKMHEMNIAHFENRCAGTLSGGNKRKLSVAISLIGKPPLVFLDEPSTGMDPVARRFMWNVISRVATKRKECSIILTTHSMEECEALCTNVGIMVGGRFRCLGSIQHLKHRFGKGYLVEVKLQHHNPDGEQAVKTESERFLQGEYLPGNRLKELAAHLGDEGRAAMVHPQGSGWAIAAAIAGSGKVHVDQFAEWWAFETVAARLNAFMKDTFAGASLVERHGEFFRYKLPELHMALSEAFAALNDAKDAMAIATYSLSQTSLEQIFNMFAAQQDEEKGHARGMGGDAGGAAASAEKDEYKPLLE